MHDPFTNNCGPGWSDGQYQDSVGEFKTEPINARDRACQIHDRDTFNANGDLDKLDQADNDFFTNNVKDPSILGLIYAVGVKVYNKTNRTINSLNHSMMEGGKYDPYSRMGDGNSTINGNIDSFVGGDRPTGNKPIKPNQGGVPVKPPSYNPYVPADTGVTVPRLNMGAVESAKRQDEVADSGSRVYFKIPHNTLKKKKKKKKGKFFSSSNSNKVGCC